MRLILAILGALLILQTIYHVVEALITGPVSFTTFDQQIDQDLVRLTAGLVAIYVARAVKPKSNAES